MAGEEWRAGDDRRPGGRQAAGGGVGADSGR